MEAKMNMPKKVKAPEKGGLTPKLYIELTMNMIPTLISRIGEKFEAAKEELEKTTDPEGQVNILMNIISDLRQCIGKGILPDGLSEEDMQNYERTHKSGIEAYLKAHPKIQAQMETLEREFESKMPPELRESML
jgi:hypothetical protein